jgi:hypothetical protein
VAGADQYLAGRDGADHGAHEERGQHRGAGEGRAEGALQAGRADLLPEGEAGAAQHDPEQSEPQRQRAGGHHCGERVREGGPEHHQREDQPDVVGLPDRGDRLVDQPPRRAPAPVAAGQQVPQAAAEVGPTQHRVQGDRG